MWGLHGRQQEGIGWTLVNPQWVLLFILSACLQPEGLNGSHGALLD